MNALAVRPAAVAYQFPLTGESVRVVVVDGEPWFVAADLCAVLGIRNHRAALGVLDEDEKGVGSADTLGGPQNMVIVSEAGMWTLTMRSRKKEAKEFRRWVTHDLIPTVRKTGGYGSAAAPADVASISRRELAQLIIAEADRADIAEQRAAALQPAAEAWTVLADTAGDYSLRDASLILNRDPAIKTGQNLLMRFIREENMVDRKGTPYARHKTHLTERIRTYEHPVTGEPKLDTQIRVTIAGIEYLRRRLAAREAA